MPISSSSTTVKTSNAPQKTPELKPIGICLPNSTLDVMSTSSTSLVTNRVTTSSSNANYYHPSSSTSIPSSAAIPVGALSVMVARFSTDHSRPQTVILHPRPLNAGTRANINLNNSQISGSSMRGSTVIAGQTFNATSSAHSPLTTSSSISVRTTQLIGGQQHQTVPLLNLSSITNSNTSVVTSLSSTSMKQLCTQRPFITSTPIESMSLVVANANDGNVVKTHPIRLHTSNDMKANNTTVHNINKITSGSRVASTLVSAQPTKMINIGASGATTGSGVSHVARVGFIGQLPASGVSTANKSGILNLTSGSLPKGFIINQSPSASTNMNTGSTTIHNMVNVSGSVASFAAQSPQTAKLPVNVNTNNMAGMTRHSVVTTTPYIHQNVSNISNISNICHPSSQRTTLHQNASINLQSSQPQQQLLQTSATTASTATASPLRPTILSSPASSPIKQQQLQPSTPSSPRPSILIRKRIANDSQSSVTPTNLFKTSTAISAQTTPQKLSAEAMSQQSCDNKSNDNYSTNDATNGVGIQSNCVTAPSTPTSDANQTPRKKPRKQLLEPFTLKSSQNIQLLNNMSDTKLNEDNCNEKESLAQLNKKPRFSLLSSYNMQWKSLQYHFLRYSDVRPKPEKKLTLSELSNEGLKKKNGWKIHHLATQMEVMSENEANVYQRLTQFLETFEKNITEMTPLKCTQSAFIPAINIAVCHLKSNSSGSALSVSGNGSNGSSGGSGGASDSSFDINTIAIKLNDLIRGNLQRSNLFSDQINEAKQLVIKLTNDHKERVGKITKKCANKRTYITK